MKPSLIDRLGGRAAPLLINIDEYGCIVAAECKFNTPYDVGVVFCHPEGDIVIGADRPSRAQFRGLDNPEFAALPYSAKKESVMAEFDFHEDEDCPWIVIDGNGEPVERTDNEDHLGRWLAEQVEWDECISWFPAWMSPHLPGYELLSALDQVTQERLGLCEVDIGGPASGGCCAISTGASREELNAALIEADLPLRVAGVGSEERRTS
jgi:hypothetical protein